MIVFVTEEMDIKIKELGKSDGRTKADVVHDILKRYLNGGTNDE